MKNNIIYHIICEGESEYNYLNLLNRFFKEESINYVLRPNSLNGLFFNKKNPYKHIEDKYKEIQNNKNKSSEIIIIWLDNDVFKRKQLDKIELKNKIDKKQKVKYIFNYENFEDFFIMHFDKDIVEKWHNICEKNNHFVCPMIKTKYEPLFKEIIPTYEKGSLSNNFKIDKIILNNLFENQKNKNIKLKCDLTILIQKIFNTSQIKNTF